ncbi:MAG: reverse transcriptase family protein [Gemmataceae bacterium]
MPATHTGPEWLYLPLPANADHDEATLKKVELHCGKLPTDFSHLQLTLDRVKSLAAYEPCVNRANELVWEQFESLVTNHESRNRKLLISYAVAHLPPRATARVLRRLAKDPDMDVRNQVSRALRKAKIREVALPNKQGGDWDTSGWLLRTDDKKVTRHKTGTRPLQKNGLPVLTNLAQLRQLLDIKSSNQLGFFLLASDKKDGPYTTHTIPKRDGSDRKCAPKKQLKWVQRQILKHILSKVPPHPAAHGFVNERSTVTNATPHVGAELVVKFDLKEFFPTVHYFRVIGLFASMGYPVGNCLFGTEDRSNQIAPVLARLCCYTPDPKKWGTAVLPQGAPTSPAISNLMCRRLDSRLAGLAEANQGVYTRYADDLTFSFKQAEGLNLGRFRWWVDQVCHQEGFTINQDKFRVIRDSQRQVVTGIVVNEKLQVPRELRRELRAILHNIEKTSVEEQAKRHPKFQGNAGAFKQYLRGIAAYLNMVQPEHDAALLKRVTELVGKPEEGTRDGGNGGAE